MSPNHFHDLLWLPSRLVQRLLHEQYREAFMLSTAQASGGSIAGLSPATQSGLTRRSASVRPGSTVEQLKAFAQRMSGVSTSASQDSPVHRHSLGDAMRPKFPPPCRMHTVPMRSANVSASTRMSNGVQRMPPSLLSTATPLPVRHPQEVPSLPGTVPERQQTPEDNDFLHKDCDRGVAEGFGDDNRMRVAVDVLHESML